MIVPVARDEPAVYHVHARAVQVVVEIHLAHALGEGRRSERVRADVGVVRGARLDVDVGARAARVYLRTRVHVLRARDLLSPCHESCPHESRLPAHARYA